MLVNLVFLPIAEIRRANGMASEVSCKNQNSSYREHILDQGKVNLVPVVGEFELTEYKWLKWGPFQGKWDLIRVREGVRVTRVVLYTHTCKLMLFHSFTLATETKDGFPKRA